MDLGKCISTCGAVPEVLAMSKLQSEEDLMEEVAFEQDSEEVAGWKGRSGGKAL